MASKAYRADSEAARQAAYDQSGEGPNPFEEGTRKHRLFEKWCRHWHRWELSYDPLHHRRRSRRHERRSPAARGGGPTPLTRAAVPSNSGPSRSKASGSHVARCRLSIPADVIFPV